MTIFSNKIEDFFKIYFPGIFSVILLSFNFFELSLFFSLIIFFIFDVGHVYSTWLRTIFDKKEIKREKLTLLTPLFVCLISFLWLYLKVPYFWSFVSYFTIFHNMRQGWGIIRWYEKLNNRLHNNEYFYYVLTLLPVVIFHFRNLDFKVSFYSDQDLLFPMSNKAQEFLFLNISFDNFIYFILLSLYLIILVSFVIKESITSYQMKKIEFNRLLSFLYFGFVYFYSFIYSKNLSQVLVFLIMSHAVPYVFIMHKYMKKNSSNYVYIKLAILLVAGGALSYYYEEHLLDNVFNYVNLRIAYFEYLFTLLYISPILSHFIWDMYLWKKDHKGNLNLYDS